MSKYLEELNKIKQEIEETKKLKKGVKKIITKKEEDYFYIKSKIKEMCLYEPEQIGNILEKLMTAYEGVEYSFNKDMQPNDPHFYYIVQPEKEEYINYVPFFYSDKEYINYELTYLSKIFLVPDEYLEIEEDEFVRENLLSNRSNTPDYIINFNNYLYKKRIDNNLINIDSEQLNDILNQFLIETKEQQIKRINENKKNINDEKSEEVYLIEEKTIYDAITRIINECDNAFSYDKISVVQNIETENLKNVQKIIHRLTIEEGLYHKASYKTIIDSNKDTYIDFLKLKDTFDFLIDEFSNNPFNSRYYYTLFIRKVENLFQYKNILTNDDIEPIVLDIINQKQQSKNRLINLFEELRENNYEIDKVNKDTSSIKEYKELKNKIYRFSMYYPEIILEILRKLISQYENIEYQVDWEHLDNGNIKYLIKPIDSSINKRFEANCMEYVGNILLLPGKPYQDFPYVTEFINYLFDRRLEDFIYKLDIDKNKLEEILGEFLKNNEKNKVKKKEKN